MVTFLAFLFQAALPVARPAPQPTPQQMMDAFHAAFGEHRARAVHAKGVMADGDFTPAPGASRLSKAVLFSGGTIPVVVRFSDFTGLPNIPDIAPEANPRGLAIRFTMAGGRTSDIVSHCFNGFPTATAEEFRQLLTAVGASGPGTAKPTPLDRFLAGHPVAKAFLTTQKPAPLSYGTLAYYGVNAFRFTDAAGKQTYVRYRFIPVTGEAFVPADERAARGPDYLGRELPTRLATGPISFEWYAQLATADDVIDDPSTAWPESRTLVKLGTIRVRRMVTDPAAADRATMFLPTNVPAGIEPADPMLLLRQSTYPISFARRQ